MHLWEHSYLFIFIKLQALLEAPVTHLCHNISINPDGLALWNTNVLI